MFLIALMGLMAALAGSAWSFASQRDRERELLFVGREYVHALDCYRKLHAEQPQPYPLALDQLLGERDKSLVSVRCLRRIYLDPMSSAREWGLVLTPQGGITGVYSLSTRTPVRTRAVYPNQSINFDGARTYQDWKFTVPVAPPAKVGAPPKPALGDFPDDGAPAPSPPPSDRGAGTI
jgi:type II secretory pathway pseudopilin PulG